MLTHTKHGYGYVTYALNTENTDYEKMAALFGLSVKATHRSKMPIAVIVNNKDNCRSDLHEIFDYVIGLPNKKVVHNMQWESDILTLSPFKETVKFECDMLCTSDISVWQHHFRNYDLCFTSKVMGFDQKYKNDIKYRKFLLDNKLPNVYNGLYYIRLTENNFRFMRACWSIFDNWKNELRQWRKYADYPPSTDFVFSIALAKCGMDNSADYTGLPTFIHNKLSICGEMKNFSVPNPNCFIIDGKRINYPFHYHHKDFCTDQLISKYKQHV